jgi:hypothetical protein
MLGLEAEERLDASGPVEVAARVNIGGAWEGTVSLSLSLDVARHFAATMLGRAAPSLSEAEVRDVIAELAHVVAGNVKGALPGPSSVFIPRVVAATASPAEPADASYWFACEERAFCVTVHEGPQRSDS